MAQKSRNTPCWIMLTFVLVLTSGCPSKPTVTITTPAEVASSAPVEEPSTAKGSYKSPNLKGISGSVDDDAPTEFTKTASGLEYRILRKPQGRKPTTSESVVVHYAGWLDDGSIFDSSYQHGQPASFGVTDVIAGWTEGLQLIGEGGMIELNIPSKLGYGSSGTSGIPPNATLHFRVELVRIK